MRVQGNDKVRKLHAVVATEAQEYVASMAEVQGEVQQLRDNLREQHRIWVDFYSTIFKVGSVLSSAVSQRNLFGQI